MLEEYMTLSGADLDSQMDRIEYGVTMLEGDLYAGYGAVPDDDLGDLGIVITTAALAAALTTAKGAAITAGVAAGAGGAITGGVLAGRRIGTSKNYKRLLAKLKKLKQEAKGASGGKKRHLDRRIKRTQRRQTEIFS